MHRAEGIFAANRGSFARCFRLSPRRLGERTREPRVPEISGTARRVADRVFGEGVRPLPRRPLPGHLGFIWAAPLAGHPRNRFGLSQRRHFKLRPSPGK